MSRIITNIGTRSHRSTSKTRSMRSRSEKGDARTKACDADATVWWFCNGQRRFPPTALQVERSPRSEVHHGFGRRQRAAMSARPPIQMDENGCKFRLSFDLRTPSGARRVQLRSPGEHMVANATLRGSVRLGCKPGPRHSNKPSPTRWIGKRGTSLAGRLQPQNAWPAAHPFWTIPTTRTQTSMQRSAAKLSRAYAVSGRAESRLLGLTWLELGPEADRENDHRQPAERAVGRERNCTRLIRHRRARRRFRLRRRRSESSVETHILADDHAGGLPNSSRAQAGAPG